MVKIYLIAGVLFLAPLIVSAEDILSVPLGKLHPPVVDVGQSVELLTVDTKAAPHKSDFLTAIKYQTKVKVQGQRNTCTVFAFTAALEALFLKKYPANKTIDFSEQWLQYLVALRSPTGGLNGSTVPINFGEIKKRGIALESELPYESAAWEKTAPALAASRCSGLTKLNLTRCLVAHRSPLLMGLADTQLLDKKNPNYDPDFASARDNALDVGKYLVPLTGGILSSTSRIKESLRQGSPLTLEINIFYGSWNLSTATSMGIERDADMYSKGIVNYPEPLSVDLNKSPGTPARHAVEIVGYDDTVAVTYTKKMTDGSVKTFTRKGVYYFKNSWGTAGFGKSFKYEKKKIPGFGMILQDHAHKYGQFFKVDIGSSEAI